MERILIIFKRSSGIFFLHIFLISLTLGVSQIQYAQEYSGFPLSYNVEDGRNRIDSSMAHPNGNAKVVMKKEKLIYPDEPANYDFHYEVLGGGNQFGHSETRRGAQTSGKYHVLLPDGRRQTVTYYVDEFGFHPTITYEYVGEAIGNLNPFQTLGSYTFNREPTRSFRSQAPQKKKTAVHLFNKKKTLKRTANATMLIEEDKINLKNKAAKTRRVKKVKKRLSTQGTRIFQ